MEANYLYYSQLHPRLNLGLIPTAPPPQQTQDAQMPHFGNQQPFNQSLLPQQSTNVSRKRPKYFRSKMGCLSCHSRQIKCDEKRPRCTRCVGRHLECTWLAEVPKSEKQQQQEAQHAQFPSESAPGLRPSTSPGLYATTGSAPDPDRLSDSGAGPIMIRNIANAHRRSSAHSRRSSIGPLQGHEPTMTSSASVSRNGSANQSRVRNPNPFAFNAAQLGLGMPSAGLNGAAHQRSASAHSTTSNTSSISSLPYPLLSRVPPVISTMTVPGLSASQTSLQSSSASFTQSPPTIAWPSWPADAAYRSHPGTSSSTDLNNIGANMGAGIGGNQIPTGGGVFAFSYDGPSGDYCNTQSFDQVPNNNLNPSITNDFDPSNYELNGNTNVSMDSLPAQLQQPPSQQNMGSYPNAMPDPSSGILPNMTLEDLMVLPYRPEYEQTLTLEDNQACSGTAMLSLDDDISHFITSVSPEAICINGRFGDIFKGTHKTIGEVALKRLRIGGAAPDEQVIRRFKREADTWRRLEHPHVLKFLGTYKPKGHLYFVSPFMQNGTLLEYINDHPGANRVKLLCETSDAIGYLHRADIIHGDIKAGNLLISDHGRVLLCDFGLTKYAYAQTSTAFKGAGTLRWQSPELWDNEPRTFASDVYAYSMTIVEVLTGLPPFPHLQNGAAVMMAVYSKDERPVKSPLEFEGVSYENAWRVAEACWPKIPRDRISIWEAFHLLKADPSLV